MICLKPLPESWNHGVAEQSSSYVMLSATTPRVDEVTISR